MQSTSKRNPLKVVSRRVAIWGSLFGCAVALAGCSGSSSTDTVINNLALVKALNAYIPAAGVDGTLTFSTGSASFGTLGFGGLGASISVTAGAFTASATGASITTPLATPANITLGPNNSPYVLAAGGAAGQTGALAPQLFVIPNYVNTQFTIPVAQDAIRVVNLSLNANPIGLYQMSGATVGSAVSSFGSVGYGYSQTNNPYVLINTVSLGNFVLVDSTNPSVPLTLSVNSNLTTQPLQTAQAYTLYIYGQPGNPAQPLTAVWTLDYTIQ